jgi:hypothetical protein
LRAHDIADAQLVAITAKDGIHRFSKKRILMIIRQVRRKKFDLTPFGHKIGVSVTRGVKTHLSSFPWDRCFPVFANLFTFY